MKVYIRHYQRRDEDGAPFYYDGTNALNISKTNSPPLGFDNVYQEITCNVTNLEKIVFKYSINEGDQHSKQELSGQLEIVGDAKEFILDWISYRPYASQNIIEIKFVDDKCNRVIDEMIIKAQKITDCTDRPCTVGVVAEANNLQYQCMAKYAISDNWNGFQDALHRSYDYAVEKSPKIWTKILYMIGSLFFLIGLSIVFTVAPLNAIIVAFGFPPIPLTTPAEVIDMMRRMLGFGRTHSAASVADYTQNIADRCGIKIDTENNLFFQPTIDRADGTTIPNPYVNLDVLFCKSERGRKNDDPDRRKIIPANSSLLTLPQLYNSLAKWANAKWYISPEHGLRFLPRYTFADDLVYDYSLQTKCEQKNGVKWEKICRNRAENNPLLGRDLQFCADPFELAGNDALPRYGSRLVLDANEDNPNLKGLEDGTIDFGAARFRDDGIEEEFVDAAIRDPMTLLGTSVISILLALIIINAISNLPSVSIALATVVITVIGLIAINIAVYAAGLIWGLGAFIDVLLMAQDTAEKPKLLLWDGNNADAARVAITPNFPNPLAIQNTAVYTDVHQYNDDPIKLYNYPVMLDCRFEDSAYHNLHLWEDRRVVSLVENVVELDLIACCEHLDLLGLYQGGERAIDKRIRYALRYKLDGTPTQVSEARTTRIEVNYSTSVVKIIAVGR